MNGNSMTDPVMPGGILGLIERILRRCHLTQSQRAAIGAEMLEAIHAGINTRVSDKGRLRDEVAGLAGVSPRYVADAARIKKESPEVFDQVKAGEKSISDAKRELGMEKPKSAAKAKASEEPKAASKGRTRVNGVLGEDPADIARLGAVQRPPEAKAVDVEGDAPEGRDAIADVQRVRDEAPPPAPVHALGDAASHPISPAELLVRFFVYLVEHQRRDDHRVARVDRIE